MDYSGIASTGDDLYSPDPQTEDITTTGYLNKSFMCENIGETGFMSGTRIQTISDGMSNYPGGDSLETPPTITRKIAEYLLDTNGEPPDQEIPILANNITASSIAFTRYQTYSSQPLHLLFRNSHHPSTTSRHHT